MASPPSSRFGIVPPSRQRQALEKPSMGLSGSDLGSHLLAHLAHCLTPCRGVPVVLNGIVTGELGAVLRLHADESMALPCRLLLVVLELDGEASLDERRDQRLDA